MKHILIAALLCGLATSAVADGRVFPPDNCSSSHPFMAFNAAPDSNTYCVDGQHVLSNALPACGPNQVVAHDGAGFVCKESGTPPECAPGEFLTFTDGTYGCGSTNVPTCAGNQVLTFNGSAFICVAKADDIPNCGANEFLTYNGASFQCAATQNLTIPTCGAGEVLTADGTALLCVAQAEDGGGGNSECSGGSPLYNGDHTTSQCACAGGVVSSIGGGESLCQFSFCPTGWKRLAQWGTTSPKSCSGANSCTTSSHAFANKSTEYCSYYGNYDSSGHAPTLTCTATLKTVGCY